MSEMPLISPERWDRRGLGLRIGYFDIRQHSEKRPRQYLASVNLLTDMGMGQNSVPQQLDG